MVDQADLLNQLKLEDNMKDQENQITKKVIRKINSIYLSFFIKNRYLYKARKRKKKGNRSPWYPRRY